MRIVIQRVNNCVLKIKNKVFSQIDKGLLAYVCIEPTDTESIVAFYANKLSGLRIFEDENGKMNLSVKDINGEILIVSNFSLTADISHGFRPSFSGCAEKPLAEKLYNLFIEKTQQKSSCLIKTGVFGADMDIYSENNGPINIIV